MPSGFTLFVDIAPIAVVILVICLVALFPYRKERTASALIVYLSLVCWLLVTNTGELLAPAGNPTKIFVMLEYSAHLPIPIAWLSFCLRYTGWVSQTRKNLIAIAIATPALLYAVALTNDLHHLVWRGIHYFELEGLSVFQASSYGPLFWAICLYCWGAIAFGSILILRSYFTGQELYHRQSSWIAAGVCLPAITNLLYIFRVIPGFQKDFTPIGYALSGVCFLVGIYMHRLFWIIPVSRGVLLDQLRVGILVLDKSGRIVDHNSAARQLFSLDEETIGKNGSDYPSLVSLLSVSKYVPGTVPSETHSGRIMLDGVPVAWTMQPSDPGSAGAVVIAEDISAQVALENDVDRIKAEFVKREKLVSIGQLSAGLAHEINNPLSYLKSDLRSLERIVARNRAGYESPDIAEILQIVKGTSDGLTRIENVVRSLLDFTRQEKTDAPAEPYDLHEGIDSTLEIMRYEYREIADVRREYGTVPPIRIRRYEINQVIFNILTNALQAIREGPRNGGEKGRITIRTGFTGTCVWCEIENDGPPIDPETAPRIFELFFTTKSDQFGTGLGLNYSHDVVEHRNHGRLFLASRDPVVFRMELPAPEKPI